MTVVHSGSSNFDIPKYHLVLLQYHPKGRIKIQDNYKSKVFVTISKYNEPDVYIICPKCGKGLMLTVNWQQLFNLNISSLGNAEQVDQFPDIATEISYYHPKRNHLKRLPNILIIMVKGPQLRPTLYLILPPLIKKVIQTPGLGPL